MSISVVSALPTVMNGMRAPSSRAAGEQPPPIFSPGRASPQGYPRAKWPVRGAGASCACWPRALVHRPADLRDAGWRVSQNTVAALIREQHLTARARRRRKATTRPGKGRWRAPDLVKRDFPAAQVNRKWCGDGTEIGTSEGKLHLSVTWNQRPGVATSWRTRQGSVSASQRGRGSCGGWPGRGRTGGRSLRGASRQLSGCVSAPTWAPADGDLAAVRCWLCT